jgi:hypothetical protein
MKRFSLITLLLVSGLIFKVHAQEATTNEKLTEVNDKVNGITERLTTAENDLAKLTKIKVSGYIQGQYQMTQSPLLDAGSNNYFSIRRARVKFAYQATDGIKFVLQPDFSPGALSIKDAYAVLNDRWTKSFSLWMGKFNRPNYEVEYSSSQRELVERSTIIRTLYPGERAIGAKLEYAPLNFPIKVQVALLNGADGLTINNSAGTNLNTNENKDFDNYKDIMARAVYKLKLGNFGGLDFGAHGYFGSLKSYATSTLSSDYSTVKSIKFGDPLKRQWVGGEFQLFADVLGGMSIKGEYIAGKNASVGYSAVAANGTAAAVPGAANFQNNFAGYYLYFIKNLGKKNQFAFRYDFYDPNTDITGKDVSIKKFTPTDATVLKSKTSGKSDLAVTTFDFALHHYFDDNLRITLDYAIVKNEKVGTSGKVVDNVSDAHGTPVVVDWSNAINQNLLTLRIQAKF